jgi:putative membrane protein
VVAAGVRLLIGALAGATATGTAWAHTAEEAVAPAGASVLVAGGWVFEPWVLACLALSLAWYAWGVTRLWRHAGAGRGLRRWRVASFVGGWLVLIVGLLSPLDSLGSWLFWVHMLQHELLMVLAAPLMVLGRPLAAWAWALPPAARRTLGHAFHRRRWRRGWKVLTTAWCAWLLHAAALWLWHVPAAFDAALHHRGLHALQHASFLFSALLFWWTVFGVSARHPRPGVALMSLFTTMLHSGALGALLALSPSVWYRAYAVSAPALGWEPLADQQLGGLLMWAPGGVAYAVAALVLARQVLATVPVKPAVWQRARSP